MRPILFHLGDFAVSSFWTSIFAAFFAAFLVARREFVRRGYDLLYAYDATLWAYVGGWVGARLFVIPTGWDYFVDDPLAFLVSSSGWAWYGGLIGGALAVGRWARRKGIPILEMADIAAPAVALAVVFGRLGCQLSGDGDYGVPSALPWAMSYPNGVVPTTDAVHPTPIYEMLWSGGIFLHLWRQRMAAPAGSLASQYLVYAGLGRFAVEFVRRNPAWLLGLTTAQWMSIGSIALGLVLREIAVRPEEAPSPGGVSKDRCGEDRQTPEEESSRGPIDPDSAYFADPTVVRFRLRRRKPGAIARTT